MTRFFGRYEHSLDVKGRIILPAKFRPFFERGGYLTQYYNRCLALWTPEKFEEQMLAREAAQDVSAEERNLARLWSSGTQEVEVDKQGRIAIPPHLRVFAHLEGEVLVHGAINRLELWNPELWSEKVEPAERDLTLEMS
ncbi:MAG: division/cell wall cluster transcriptional repressor MraZ [Actinomycetota bacterium]|nr:division/cell wall cluster transcriptional repressor MraZ [Actinomycetota bacterium]MDQ3680750.1 division/cell wall cluster transcriptional repressor MraZ [Actinomycetota bacterium]